ncbi:DUF4232 domain-containing protein [Nakamurella deserti]|uniref:DUF4232 domain-containing protein n=1 Tax=Nakamurella deserti TaxID=2164074 RepID=UPI001300399D|nr:DUF4232 domain-containing protein [Nakamurella deserti]
MSATAARSVRRSVAVLVAGVALTAGCAGTSRPAATGTAGGFTTTVADSTTTVADSATTVADSTPAATAPTPTGEVPPTPSSVAGTAATTDVPAAAAGRCADGGVPVIQGGADAAMGARYVALTAVNCTSAPIELSGFPEIEMFEADGAPVNVAPVPGVVGEVGTDQPSHTVSVAPGGSAFVRLSWRNLTETDAPVTAESVVVTPGPGLAPQTVPMTVDLGTTYEAYVTSWTLTPPDVAVPLTVPGTAVAGSTAITG